MRKRKRSSPQSPGSNKKMTLDPSRKDEETDFLFRSPFRPQQKAKAIQNCLASINRDLECIKSHGLEEFTKRRASEMTEEDDDNNPATDVGKEENLGSAFDGTLRDYQIFMLERAKAENTIVHLGTGMGKTLISIMLMKDFLAREKNNSTSQAKKILFLVPSIALAVQHTDTLRANLPCKVETACHSSSNTTRAKEEIAAADVVVATHGAAIDLLTHYPEVLSLRHVSLMVMDECHYSTGGHNYATILREFYHKNLPEGERPRILGLTASPLINISVKTNAEQLQSLLSNFERIMNARLVGFPTGDGTSSTSRSDVEQAVVEYHSNETITLPNIDGWKLHPERKKEIDQLQVLCDDVGPAVTAVYSRTLAREVSRNEFAEESQQQCDNLKAYLLHVASYLNQCVKESKPGPDGHTDKMKKLEKLLNMVLRTDGGPLQESPVGIVFVEMRITAIALSNYFSKRNKGQKFDSDMEVPSNLSTEGHNDDDVFADAENDDSMDFRVDLFEAANTVCTEETTPSRPLIRCDAAVRRKTHIFKYLSRQKVLNERHQQDLEEEWVHQTTQIRTIIRKLRNRDINLLFATSIVEEGVDVEACSFVISLDAIKNVKSYIQMKGRARQKCAKFFLFAEAGNSQPLSLNNALAVENIVHKFIAEREIEYISEYNASSINLTDCELECVEETAMHRGVYRTHVAFVDLASSKSLLNRYALSVPIDPNCRTSQRAILLHMPIYKENSLILPTHIPPDIRTIKLPQFFYEVSKKKKHSLMALAACVRLHRLGLLNDRLLPLSDADMKSWLIGIALNELPPCNVLPSLTFNTPCTVYLYKFNQHGERFNNQEKSICNGVDRRLRLALASLNPLPNNLPSVSHCHNELGLIECSIAYIGTEVLSEYEWESLSDFHCTLFNARWRRKSKSKWLSFDDKLLTEHPNPYVIGCLDNSDRIDWNYIETIIDEFSRTTDARKQAVQDYNGTLASARICNPSYSSNTSYIVYGASEKTCQDNFATSEYKSFKHYYSERYRIELHPDGKMYRARRMFEFPQSSASSEKSEGKDIPIIEIPQELICEAIVADPLLILHSIILPQIIYKIERHLGVHSFIKHALHNYPILGKCVSELPIELLTEALTAKSCTVDVTYDRLEWLGDAVLKLLHTDALLKWKRTFYLHEGYLSLLRSAMGSNERLHNCAKITGIADYVLLTPLSRAEWLPCGLFWINEENEEKDDSMNKTDPPLKVCADVIESLLGLIYLNHGMADATRVACEIGVSFNYGDKETDKTSWSELSVDSNLIAFASSFLGVSEFQCPQLLVEATTHQSCLHKPVPSYQRLEWIGDAVLCLAIREWLYRFDANLTVPKLVVLETTLECNETLAFLGLKKGLCQFIDHRDGRLPSRFEKFQRDLEAMGRGLWSTDPPKVIPDVVEALIGAAHVDLGLEQGQKAAIHVIHPILQSISAMSLSSDLSPSPSFSLGSLTGILHPKQHLYEYTSGIVRVRAHKSDKFHSLGISSLSIEDKEDGEGFVGVVSCKGLIIVAVWESSNRAAINVACSLAVELLSSNPSILAKLHDIHLISSATLEQVDGV